MDVIRDLIQTSNASRLKVRIVNNNGIFGVVATNETTPTLPTEIAAPSAMPTAISVVGATSGTIGTTERVISFPYSGTAATKDYTFTTTENLICDILVVGGGGGGGKRHGGGGGAGTLLYHKNITLNGTYNIKVGKGGTGVPSTGFASGNTVLATSGIFSQFIKSDGSQEYYANGGGSGGYWGGAGSTAITNGGQSVNIDTNINLPLTNKFNGVTVTVSNKQYVNTLTSPEGCRGNIGGIQINNYKGGGGGGAGGVGMNHAEETTINDGYGGLGLAVDITGASVVYAGGGNGSDFSGSVSQVFDPIYPTIQSRGGGGFGSDTGTGQNGLDGTGGGGGGQGNDADGFPSGSGGSGIVIIRYRKPSSEIVVSSTIAGTTDRIISFPYTGTGATKDYTITTTEALSCDILIVGGGGAGGNSMGGGGGAGGVVYAINQTLSTGTYTVKVGRGGIGLTLTDATGQGTIGIDQDGAESSLMNSNASSYISLTLAGVSQQLRGYGGGGGGIYYNPSFVNGRNGGSGGGCAEYNPGFVVNTPGSATQPATYWNGTAYVVGGKAGRQNTTTVQDYQAGGGGGLGGVSADYRNGNDGVAIDITGTSQFYAAGGGAGQYIGTSIAAGLGGSSIGGNGRIWAGSAYAAAPRDVATSGANGTGSGGGGAAYTQTPVSPAGNGGSGIIIIRYRKATNTVSNTLFSISNGGVISTSTNVYSNVIINYVDSSNVSSGTSSTGISSQWTTVSGGSITNIYYNTSNVGIGTLDPVAPLHIYNNTITPLPTAISVVGATSGTIGTTERVISFPYTGSAITKDYTFTTTENLICDILVVGGGGCGGRSGGGGGAVLYTQNVYFPTGGYTVKVGNGGISLKTGGVGDTQGANGNDSDILFGAITIFRAKGGGFGAANYIQSMTGGTGGSGGGSENRDNIPTFAPSVVSNANIISTNTSSSSFTTLTNQSPNGITIYGNRGGIGGSATVGGNTGYSGGGGGGAGGVGGNLNTSTLTSGAGGAGISINITGSSIKYGSGGASGIYNGSVNATQGTSGTVDDGGGTGAYTMNTTSVFGSIPTAGRGGGGGGWGVNPQTGEQLYAKDGGSGIVIIRYRLPTVVSNSRLLLDTTTTGTPSIEFRRGVGADMQNDYRLINDTTPANGTIKLLCENSTQSFNDTTANLAWFSSNETIIHKNTSMNGRVGIGTVYHSTRRLDVLGDANVSGVVSVGGLSVSGSSSNGVTAIISNSLTSNVSLTIRNGMIPPSITSSPVATTTGTTGAFTYQVFTYTTETAGAGTGQSLYTLTVGAGGAVCDVLVVGGGGAGGMQIGAGGGGGAVLYGTNISIIQGTYTIKVGRGATPGETLGKSTEGFGATILGGGSAGNANWGANPTTANSGGSGAGGKAFWGVGSSASTLVAGGVGVSTKGTILTTSTLYNGNVGGTAVQQVGGNPIQSAGGGGAGAVGGNGNGSGSQTGNGGAGVLVNITGINYYWGGGGGGGNYQSTSTNGGRGGGGAGERNDGGGSLGFGTGGADAYNAPVNMNAGAGSGGGGGGGGYGTSTAGNGGSGIVIIRYLTSTSSSIELIRGTAGDANRDYKIGNYNAEFKVLSSVSNTDTDYIKITTAGAITNPTGTASWNTGSDRRIKENIERASYDKCFDNINRLELNRFNYIDGFNTVSRDRAQLGFIAQEVKDIFPKSISTQGYYSDTLNIPDLLSIDISQINYSLYGAVKKLIEINKEDKEKLASLDNRLKTITNFLNISLDTNDIVIDSSNMVIDNSNIVIDSSNLVIDSSNMVIDSSNIVIDSSNIVIDSSNIVIDSSNIVIDSSNIAIDTSNLLDTSNITIDSSNIVIDTSNLLDTSNISIDTSNIAIDTSNLLDTSSNISIDTSNIAIDTSNLLDTSSNISIE